MFGVGIDGRLFRPLQIAQEVGISMIVLCGLWGIIQGAFFGGHREDNSDDEVPTVCTFRGWQNEVGGYMEVF
jgi:hypothetical protein